jgi:hypothetical protein
MELRLVAMVAALVIALSTPATADQTGKVTLENGAAIQYVRSLGAGPTS